MRLRLPSHFTDFHPRIYFEMSIASTFWLLGTGHHDQFYHSVRKLKKLCPVPAPERENVPGQDHEDVLGRYTLSARDERIMADTLAYFSARDKGGPYVMAVTVQEQHSPFLKGGRIDAFVSGNDIPPQKTIGLLQDTLHIMEDCAIRGGKSSSMSTA